MPKARPESARIVAEVTNTGWAESDAADVPPIPDPTRDVDVAPDSLGFAGLDDAREFVNGVWYGPEGTGKTTATLSMANLGRVLLVNAEGGAKKTALAKRGIDTGNIAIWPDPRRGERASFDGLERLFYQLEAELSRDPSAWFGVTFDSGTEVSLLLRENQTGAAMRASSKRNDRWAVDRDDWRVMSDQMRVLIRRFRDLPCHFAMTCLERQDEVHLEDTNEDVQMWGPAVNPGLQSDLLGYVDLVIRCGANELATSDGPVTEYVGRTRRTRQYRAKDRFDATPRELFNPSFLRVLSYVQGELGAGDDPDQTAGLELRAAAGQYQQQLAEQKATAKATARTANSRTAKAAAS